MHELSICTAIMSIAADHARGREVTSVRVRVGHLRQVVVPTLRYCWELTVRSTELEGATLEVVEVPGELRCRVCGALTRLERPEFRCAACSSSDVEVTAGEELLVESLDVAAA